MDAFYETMKVVNGKTVILFTQPRTCAPCRALKPHLEKFAQTRDDIKVVGVDLDTVPEAMVQFNIMSVPTMLLVEPDKEPVEIKGRTIIQLNKEL